MFCFPELRKLFIICSILLTLSTNVFGDQGPLISKSAIVYIAEEKSQNILPGALTYIPYGERIFELNKTIRYYGKKRNLVLTESGLHVYMEPKDYFNSSEVNYLKQKGAVVFIKRKYTAKIPINKQAEIILYFTRGENYILVDEDDEGFKINLSKSDKINHFSPNVDINLKIPRKHAKMIRFDDELNISEINFIEYKSIGGIIGIKKSCDSDRIEPCFLNNNSSSNLSEFFSGLGLDGNSEKNQLLSYGVKNNVERKYYGRKNEPGIYKITKIKVCEGEKRYISYNISTPYNSDVLIDSVWISQSKQGLYADDRSGRVIISCPDSYFKFAEELKENFQERDIPFILYKTSKWKNFRNVCRE